MSHVKSVRVDNPVSVCGAVQLRHSLGEVMWAGEDGSSRFFFATGTFPVKAEQVSHCSH